ncbi:hypothetical protein ACWDAZ_42265, partial [Streptomyces sp. NPDC001215]
MITTRCYHRLREPLAWTHPPIAAPGDHRHRFQAMWYTVLILPSVESISMKLVALGLEVPRS